MSEAKSWSETPMLCSKQRAGHGSSLHSKGREVVGGGRLPVKGGTDVRLTHWLPEKPAEEHAPYCPFDKPA